MLGEAFSHECEQADPDRSFLPETKEMTVRQSGQENGNSLGCVGSRPAELVVHFAQTSLSQKFLSLIVFIFFSIF